MPKLLETRTNFKNFWQGFLIKNLAKFRARNSSFDIWEPAKQGAANSARKFKKYTKSLEVFCRNLSLKTASKVQA
jgi:hypothetical protein